MEKTEELYESGEVRYLRLGADGKIHYITKAEAMAEEVLARPRVLTDEDIITLEWNDRVKVAEKLKEQISLTHKMMQVDGQRPSRFQAGYDALWDEYREAVDNLREIDSGSVDEFKDRVATRVRELEVKLNAMCDNWNPDGFEDFEQTLTRYEKNYDLMMALQSGLLHFGGNGEAEFSPMSTWGGVK